MWLIRDGQRDFATGCVGSPADKGPPEDAQQALADYIVNKYRPTRKARDIEQIDIADVLSIYLDDCGDDQADRKKFEGRISRLNSFWGGRMLSDVSTATCKEYVKVRGNTGGARRDLEDLRAAIGHHASGKSPPRHRQRLASAKGRTSRPMAYTFGSSTLLWACWRHREIQTRHRGSDKGRKLPTDKRPLRHLARFILIGIYTGTRASAIAAASPQRAAGRSFVDLDQGIFYRLAQGKTRHEQASATGADTAAPVGAHAAVGAPWPGWRPFRRIQRQADSLGQDRFLTSCAACRAIVRKRQDRSAHATAHRRDVAHATRCVDLASGGISRHVAPKHLIAFMAIISPDHLKGAANAITGKNANVSVVVSVVEKNEARANIRNPNKSLVGPGGLEPPTRPL